MPDGPGAERITCPQLGEHREIAVSGEQFIDPVRDANSRNPRVVNHPASDMWTLYETAENVSEIGRLTDHAVKRRT